MSLLHLVHKNVAIKFADVANNQFNPDFSYAFRLAGVDAMGFLEIQDLRTAATGAEIASEPYWINKDLVREIRQVDLAAAKGSIHYTGKAAPEPKLEQADRDVTPKAAKVKVPAKPRTALKPKPVLT